MLYSIGKDSSVLLRIAQKAFAPAKLPFPLLHVDTTYKFREMIEFRDRTCRELGLDLIVSTNQKAQPRSSWAPPNAVAYSKREPCWMPWLSIASMPRSVELAGRRNDRAPRSAFFHSATPMVNGTHGIRGRSYGISSTAE